MTDHSIGASDVAGILGLSPWQTPAQTWARLTGLTVSEGSAATARGHLIERALLMDAADRMELPYLRRNDHPSALQTCVAEGAEYSPDRANSLRHPTHQWAACRPDAMVYRQGRPVALIEAKTTRSFADWQDANGNPILPPAYFAQVQWQMFVTGIAVTHVEAFCTMTDERRSIKVEYHPRIAETIFYRVETWRQRHLIGGEVPDNITADIAGLIWPAEREPETWLEADQSAYDDVYSYMHWSEVEKQAARQKSAIRDRLVLRIQDATGFAGLCSWRTTKRGRTFRVLLKGGEE